MTEADLYLRQSRARDDSISLEIQEALCRQHAERHGYTVGRVIVDEGVSGYREWEKRPNFPSVMEGGAEVVVVYRWSRLSRRRLDQALLIDMLEKKGKRVESATEPVDPSTAGGRLGRDQMLLIAAYESDVKSEQWREALQRRVNKGLPSNGGPRFGFRKVNGAFEPDPVTGPILRELYLRYTGGAGFQSLCADLNDRGVTTTRGGTWGVQTLSRALDSGFGAGLLVSGRPPNLTYSPGAHDSVISEDEWQAFQVQRARRRVAAPRRRTARWFLAGLAVCGKCGGRMIVTTHKEGKSQALCSTYHNQRACTGVWIKRQALEHHVALWLGGHLDELPERTSTSHEVETLAASLTSDLEEVLASLGRLAEGYAEGIVDADGYRAAQASLMERRGEVERALQDARAEAVRLAPVDRDDFNRLEVGDITPGEWNVLLGRVLRRAEVHADRLVMMPMVGEATEITRHA